MNNICYIFLIIHLLFVLFTVCGIIFRFLDIHKYMLPIVILLPFWGFLIVLILHFQVRIKADNIREIGIEKMQLDSEIYRSINIEEQNPSDSIIPLEEALIVNSAKERRKLIMDVLNDNPKEYIEFLQKAGDNDDTEVVHYAVTAMVEISKENDYMLQKLETQYAKNPDDFTVITEYSDFLWMCLEQKLMQGQVETMNRLLFSELLNKKLKEKKSAPDYIRLIKNALKLKNFTDAKDAIDAFSEFLPDSEDLILLKLEYFASLGRGEDIKKLLHETKEKNLYLSRTTKEAIAFWSV